MRVLLAALLALLLLPAASAQMDFSQPYQVRGAVGDIPTTTAVEPAGAFNLEQRLAITLSSPQQVTLGIPRGADVVSATAGNGTQGREEAGRVAFNLTAGAHTILVTTSQPFTGRTFSLELEGATAHGPAVAIFYVPAGSTLDAPVPVSQTLPCTSGAPCTIQVHQQGSGAPLPDPFWVSLHPTGPAGTTDPSSPGTDDDSPGLGATIPWLVGGLILGALLWALLVSRGMVQARSRRQVVATAAHVEVAKAEPLPVLEGKKRALLAALKDVELARQNNDMPVEVYDQVKADFKKQAVTVMRAIDEAGGKA